jgi:hypothetical protein
MMKKTKSGAKSGAKPKSKKPVVPIETDMRCATHDDSIGIKASYPMMPREYRQLVLPCQLHLSSKHHYIPHFDSRANRCWWEPLDRSRADSENDGWTFYQKRTRGSKAVENNDDNSDDHSDEEDNNANSSPDDRAWASFYAENERRDRLAQKWMDKNMK